MNLSKLLFPALFLFMQSTASGQTVILTLDNVPSGTLCNEIWTEQNLDLSFVNTTADDCTLGNCNFGIEPTSVWLYPTRLTIDLSSLQSIQKVEVDILDVCGTDCTQAFLMDSTGMMLNNVGNSLIGFDTLTILNPTEGLLSELAISSCEGEILEVRIYQNLEWSIHEFSNSTINIYPNPVIDVINIDVSNKLNFSANIYNIEGKLIISTTNQTVIEIQTLSLGTYLVEIKDLDTGQVGIETIIKGK